MIKKYETWRKATAEELAQGSAEMIRVSEEIIDSPIVEEKTTDIVSLLKTQTPEQLIEIKKLLGL